MRAFQAVGGDPIFVRAAHGAVIETVDGERLTDYVLSWGPLLLGHAHPAVQTAIQDALEVIRVVPRETLFAPRTVGRGALPTNVFGLLSHLAQHTQRHTGQLITTAKIIRGLGLR